MKKFFTLLMLALFSIGAWAIEAGKVYTIKAHFSNRNDLYFTVRGGQLCFDQMREASEDIYKWEAVATGHTTYPWAFKNVATNKYLNGRGGNVVDAYTTGSNEVGCFKITECSGNYAGYYNLNAVATNRNLGTWSSGDTSSKGFGGTSCFGTNSQYDGNWTTYYEIEEATDAVEWYTLQATATEVKYLYGTGNVENGKVYVKQTPTAPACSNIDQYLWKIEGDDAHGYKVVNKKTGKFIGCENLAGNGNTPAILTDNETADGVYTRFKLGGYQAALQVLNGTTATSVFINPCGKAYNETRFWVANNDGNTQRVKSTKEYIPQIQSAITAAYAKNGCIGSPSDMSGIAAYSEDGGVTSDNVFEAIDAYNTTLSNTTINLPEDGKAYYFVNYQVASNSKTLTGNKYMLTYNAGATNELVTEAFTEGTTTPNENNIFIARKVDGNRFVFVTKDGKFLRYYANSSGNDRRGALSENYSEHDGSVTINKQQLNGTHTQVAIDECFGFVTLNGWRESKSKECEIIINGKDGSFSGTDGSIMRCNSVDDQYSTAWRIVEVPDYNTNKVVLTKPESTFEGGLNDKYVGTFSAPYTVQLPDGVVAYKATENGNSITFETIGNVVPKNVGVLVYAENAEAPTNELAIPAAAIAPTVDGNALAAMINGTVSVGDYVLGKGSKGVGFYPRVTAVEVHNKAFIPAATASNLNAFRFDFEDTLTGIDEIVEDYSNAAIFDLQGRRVQSAKNGLYIVNGKKVIK